MQKTTFFFCRFKVGQLYKVLYIKTVYLFFNFKLHIIRRSNIFWHIYATYPAAALWTCTTCGHYTVLYRNQVTAMTVWRWSHLLGSSRIKNNGIVTLYDRQASIKALSSNDNSLKLSEDVWQSQWRGSKNKETLLLVSGHVGVEEKGKAEDLPS